MIFIEGRMKMLRGFFPDTDDFVLRAAAKMAGIESASTVEFLRRAKQILNG